MNKLTNPYPDKSPCFGCSPSNPIGLHLHFYEDGEDIVSVWKPGTHYQGFINILHGGIQATIMDEIASWTVMVKAKTAGVTSDMRIKYHKPVRMDKGNITIRSTITEKHKRLLTIYTRITDKNDCLCTEGWITYFAFPEEVAKRKYYYPGVEKFYAKD